MGEAPRTSMAKHIVERLPQCYDFGTGWVEALEALILGLDEFYVIARPADGKGVEAGGAIEGVDFVGGEVAAFAGAA